MVYCSSISRRFIFTNKLYKDCWGSMAPDGTFRPFGEHYPETDYIMLCEVKAVQKTVYTN